MSLFDRDEECKDTGPIVGVIFIILTLIMCPLAMLKAIKHCNRMKHKYQIWCFNFTFDIECHDCKEVFLKELP